MTGHRVEELAMRAAGPVARVPSGHDRWGLMSTGLLARLTLFLSHSGLNPPDIYFSARVILRERVRGKVLAREQRSLKVGVCSC